MDIQFMDEFRAASPEVETALKEFSKEIRINGIKIPDPYETSIVKKVYQKDNHEPPN